MLVLAAFIIINMIVAVRSKHSLGTRAVTLVLSVVAAAALFSDRLV